MRMPDIIIHRVLNGYFIEQRKKDYDWTNQWAAESIKSLLSIINNICELSEAEEKEEE